jgi:hypothetical protein
MLATEEVVLQNGILLRQGLLYRWTEHSADFLKNDYNWGREKGCPNYTLPTFGMPKKVFS